MVMNIKNARDREISKLCIHMKFHVDGEFRANKEAQRHRNLFEKRIEEFRRRGLMYYLGFVGSIVIDEDGSKTGQILGIDDLVTYEETDRNDPLSLEASFNEAVSDYIDMLENTNRPIIASFGVNIENF